ncbi:MAG: hypothetical protein M3P11_12935 [Actinomycetota bacterium]|nr:hypothetical protein [Actinomycetota bacterium]
MVCRVCDAPLPTNTGGRPRVTCSKACAAIRRRALSAAEDDFRYFRAHAEQWNLSAERAEAESATHAEAYRGYAKQTADRLARFQRAAS